jgi:hypothetical protein
MKKLVIFIMLCLVSVMFSLSVEAKPVKLADPNGGWEVPSQQSHGSEQKSEFNQKLETFLYKIKTRNENRTTRVATTTTTETTTTETTTTETTTTEYINQVCEVGERPQIFLDGPFYLSEEGDYLQIQLKLCGGTVYGIFTQTDMPKAEWYVENEVLYIKTDIMRDAYEDPSRELVLMTYVLDSEDRMNTYIGYIFVYR